MEEYVMKKFLSALTAFAVLAGSATVFISSPVLAEEVANEAYYTITPLWPDEGNEPFPKFDVVPLSWPDEGNEPFPKSDVVPLSWPDEGNEPFPKSDVVPLSWPDEGNEPFPK